MNSGIRDSLRFFLGKLLQMIVVLLILSFLVFVIARLCPGEPLRAYYGDGIEHMSQAQKEAAREKLGLDASLPAQYVHWFSGLLHGDLGLSFKYKQPVGEVIGDMWQKHPDLRADGICADLYFCGSAGIVLCAAGKQHSRQDHLQSGYGQQQYSGFLCFAAADYALFGKAGVAAGGRRLFLWKQRQPAGSPAASGAAGFWL